jgi:hypothetical protein
MNGIDEFTEYLKMQEFLNVIFNFYICILF